MLGFSLFSAVRDDAGKYRDGAHAYARIVTGATPVDGGTIVNQLHSQSGLRARQ